jgi:hypothetical protein
VGDIAFLPVEVLLVGVVLERLLTRREKSALAHKLNMVIGVFFGRMGTDLLRDITACSGTLDEVKRKLGVRHDWTRADFVEARRFARDFDCAVDLRGLELVSLRDRLLEQRDFLVRLLENPIVLEHQDFSDLLWSLFHLTEELEVRTDLAQLGPSDAAHLSGDVTRVYRHLLFSWVGYTEHLKSDYPYLFSLVCRVHPLQDNPSPVVV